MTPFELSRRTPLQRLLYFGGMVKAASGKAVEDTATGNPLTFLTDLAKPLKSLVANFLPIQSGTGDPSPENIRPITGWDAVNAWCAGKNLLDPSTIAQGGINSDGVAVDNQKRIRTDYIPVKENTYYSLSAGAEYKAFMHFYDKDKGSIGNNTVAKAKAPTGACFVRGIIGYQDETNIVPSDCTTGQLEVVAQNGLATEYEPFVSLDTYPVTFPSTIYGGYVDLVTGVLSTEWARVKISDLEWQYQANWNGRFRAGLAGKDGVDASVSANLMCDCYKSELGTNSNDNIICGYGKGNSGLVYIKDSRFTDKDDFVDAVGDYYIYYPLLTPQEIQLTPQQINAIKGNNTVWSDGNGDCSVVYLKKG